jgi:hypothetical protein
MTVLNRARGWLVDETTPVVLTAIAVAIPGAYLGQHSLGAEFEAGFLLLLALGVGVPTVYERWPRRYGVLGAVAWALVACAVVAALFGGTYLLLVDSVGEFPATVVAFAVADLGPLAVVAELARG